jgi:hypothetical protein
VGDAVRAPDASHGEVEAGSSWLARSCLVVVIIGVFVVVVMPALIWAAGILIAGGR